MLKSLLGISVLLGACSNAPPDRVVSIHGWDRLPRPMTVVVDGASVAFERDSLDATATFKMPGSARTAEVRVGTPCGDLSIASLQPGSDSIYLDPPKTEPTTVVVDNRDSDATTLAIGESHWAISANSTIVLKTQGWSCGARTITVADRSLGSVDPGKGSVIVDVRGDHCYRMVEHQYSTRPSYALHAPPSHDVQGGHLHATETIDVAFRSVPSSIRAVCVDQGPPCAGTATVVADCPPSEPP